MGKGKVLESREQPEVRLPGNTRIRLPSQGVQLPSLGQKIPWRRNPAAHCSTHSCLDSPMDRSLAGSSPRSHRVRYDLGTEQQLEADVILYPESRLPWGPVGAQGERPQSQEPGFGKEGRQTTSREERKNGHHFLSE